MKIQTVIDEMSPQLAKTFQQRAGVKQFIEKYADIDTNEFNWISFCKDINEYGCFMFGFALIRRLLQEGLYVGPYKNELYARLDDYSIIGKQKTASLKDIMCGDRISQQIIYPNVKRNTLQCYSFAYVNTDNAFIIHMLEKYLKENTTHVRFYPRVVLDEFGKSFESYENAVTSVSDFSATTMFKQANYYKTYFHDNEEMRRTGIKLVVNFYRWLVRSNPEHSFFENEFHMSDRLLFNHSLSELIDRGFYFTTLNPANIPYGKEVSITTDVP